MPVSIEELQSFLNNPTYARFMNTNLHLHTPATPWDWDSWTNQTRQAGTISPEEYFNLLNQTSLELVAITDHNTVAWCKTLIDLAAKARAEHRSKLHILPGVEITTYEGPHVIAIFDELTDPENIKLMLTRLGMSGKGEKEDKVGRLGGKFMIQQVFQEILNQEGIIIGPHVGTGAGLWGPKDFRSRNDVLNDGSIRILAAPSGDIKRVIEGDKIRLLFKNMNSEQISNSFAFINVSDCHRLQDFELDTTWIKMTKASLEGVRQIIYEPEMRVCHNIKTITVGVEFPESFWFSIPSPATHPYIIATSISGGMLDGFKVQFSPHQNSIIGRNYAGKSALLDCLRFALNNIPEDSALHDKFADRMKAFVGEGGEVRVYVNVDDKIYGISRVFSCSTEGRKGNTRLVIDGSSNVSLLWDNKEFKNEAGLGVDEQFPIEVYPQGEVVKIKDNVSQQMKIVESLAHVDSKKQDLYVNEIAGTTTSLGKLKENRELIIAKNKVKEGLLEATSLINSLEAEIKDLDELNTSPAFAEKRTWSEQEVSLDSYKKELTRLDKEWSSQSLLPSFQTKKDEINEPEHSEKQEPVPVLKFDPKTASPEQYGVFAKNLFVSTCNEISNNRSKCSDLLKSSLFSILQLEVDRKARADALDTQIINKLKPGEQPGKGDLLIERITVKRKKLNELLVKKQELEQLESEIQMLVLERNNLLKSYFDKWKQVKIDRSNVVTMISRGCAANIKAELIENSDRNIYRQTLDEIADHLTNATNKFSNKRAQLDEIVEKMTPTKLVEVIKQADAEEFARCCSDVTPHSIALILSMEQNDLLRLEECLLDDRFVISFRKENEIAFTQVDKGLSGGEQALALISIAMVPKRFPLIIDQPEDELGPGLITRELVEQIRRVKSERQLIFVTHVPTFRF